MDLTRRHVLGLAALAGAGVAGTTVTGAARAAGGVDWNALERALDGPLLRSGDRGERRADLRPEGRAPRRDDRGPVRRAQLHRLLDPEQRAVPAGSCPTVGVGGSTLGGGIGVLARAYGLTSDHLRAATVVTADGDQHTVDAHHGSDLFWALRGGGGGNGGVVTSFTFTTAPWAGTRSGPVARPRPRADPDGGRPDRRADEPAARRRPALRLPRRRGGGRRCDRDRLSAPVGVGIRADLQRGSKSSGPKVAAVQSALAPLVGSGAYVNYVNLDLENWGTAYYGANLARLKRVVTAYDPTGVFTFRRSVLQA